MRVDNDSTITLEGRTPLPDRSTSLPDSHVEFSWLGRAVGQLARVRYSSDDPEDRRRSVLLAWLTLAMMATVFVVIAIMAVIEPSILRDEDTWLYLGGTSFLLISYLLNRYGRFQLAAAVTILAAMAIPIAAPFLPGSAAQMLAILIVPVLLSAFIVSSQLSAVVAVVSLTASAAIVILMGMATDYAYLYTLIIVAVLDSMILAFMFYQEHLEQTRRSALDHANQRLRQSEAQLERGVQERTNALQAANTQLREEIARREHVEAELIRRRDDMLMLISSMQNLLLVVDDNDRMVSLYAPPHFRSYLESLDIMPGRALAQLLPAQMAEGLARACTTVRQTGAPEITELVVPAGDQTVTFEARIAPVEGMSQVMVVVDDITRRKSNEEALEAANQRLQELDRLKDEFMDSVSHELRTPITNLKIYHHLLGHRPPNWDSYLETAAHETQRLEAIIESILSVTQIMKQLQNATTAPVDLAQLITRTVTNWRPRAEMNELDLSYQPGAELPPITGNQALLERVLTILVDNALKYTPRGGKIRFSSRLDTDADQSWAVISIANSGPAIPPDEASQMFNRFFRGKAALESGVSGAGMGLFMASQIVARHGGSITLDDLPGADGGGVTFTIRLPVGGQRGGTLI